MNEIGTMLGIRSLSAAVLFQLLWSAVISILLCSCSPTKPTGMSVEEDMVAKALFQGIWINEETDQPLFHVVGDTVFYADKLTAPVSFKIIHDSLHIYNMGNKTKYKIDRQTESQFWLHAHSSQEMIRLYKSEDSSDFLFFENDTEEVPSEMPQQMKRDSIIYYNGIRYHGYINISPSTIKVFKTKYLDNGMAVENIYYDNIIHICVYEGTHELYGQNIQKSLFCDLYPEEYLKTSILSDMHFVAVDESGFHFHATLTIPETNIYHVVSITILGEKVSFAKL